jgi:hypothetical protein
VTALLRLAAMLSLAWAVLLLGLKDCVIEADQLSSVARAFANGLGLANVVFAYVFWFAARDAAANRGAIYGAMLLSALKTANDLYELLALLPPDKALISLADLVLSVGLLVGILEALPRTLAARPKAPE